MKLDRELSHNFHQARIHRYKYPNRLYLYPKEFFISVDFFYHSMGRYNDIEIETYRPEITETWEIDRQVLERHMVRAME